MADLTRAVESSSGSSGGRTYQRVLSGEHGGEFATTNTYGATSAQSTPAPYKPRPKKGGGGSAPAAPRSSSRFKTLAVGEDNDPAAVADMQRLLTALGLGSLTSGVYDKDTEAAVKEAQRRLGIKNPNGKANHALVAKMLNAYDLSPCVKRSEDPDPDDVTRADDCAFTVTRSEEAMFDTLRELVADEDAEAVQEPMEEPVARAMTSADMPYGDVTYADPGYQADGKKRYPLDSEEHCRAAWSYINKADNAAKYSPEELARIKGKIKAALKRYGVEVGDETQRSCCPDCLDGENHVFRREFELDGIDIIRGGQGGDGRTVEAYATVFDSPTEVKDQHGHYMETIHRSAFDDVLRGGFGRVKVFYNHGMGLDGRPSDMWSVPIGTPVDIRVDGKGLRTITRFNEGADGDRVLEAIRNNAITGYSFRGPIRQSNPPRIPRPKDGHPLPTVVRTKLGLTEYGPTPMPYYAGASILALRSRLSTLDESKWDRLVELLSAATPEDQEALRTALTATPTEGPGAEDQPEEALRSASMSDIRRKAAVARILEGMPRT